MKAKAKWSSGKLIGGKRFYLWNSVLYKSMAKEIAARRRRDGVNARVIKNAVGHWEIWSTGR